MNMSLEICGVLLKLNQHFSMALNVFNVLFNTIWVDTLLLAYIMYVIDRGKYNISGQGGRILNPEGPFEKQSSITVNLI